MCVVNVDFLLRVFLRVCLCVFGCVLLCTLCMCVYGTYVPVWMLVCVLIFECVICGFVFCVFCVFVCLDGRMHVVVCICMCACCVLIE